jgi:DNA helicase HerA-like ATPase
MMAGNEGILVGGVAGGAPVTLDPRMANRHGLIAGATGTGKTVSLQLLAEGFSRIGVPVFLADIKGDLSGLAKPAQPGDKVRQRIVELGLNDYQPRGNPVVFWDLHGVAGHPLRATISEAGPLLLSTMLELNDTQTGVLYSCFKLADDNGLLLLDLKDLRAILSWAGDNSSDLGRDYGNLSSSSIGAIQRKLLVLEQQGADRFFGEPAIRLQDLLQTDFSGNGVIGVLDVTRLFANAPRLYAAFLLWLLSELFEQLPEVGDANKPRLVFFLDEAHLLFENAPRALLDKIEQVVRLIRSKGVGVYFISQSPLDIPQDVLGQLGLRIQHALRAFTPKDQKAVKTAAETFRPNPRLDTAKVITELGIGEALVSVLDARGSPTPVERVLICPPESRIGPLSDEERREHLSRSPFAGRYDEALDRESAYELLKARAQQAAAAQAKREQGDERAAPRGHSRQSVAEAMVTSAARAIGSQIGRQIMRGVLGSIMRSR